MFLARPIDGDRCRRYDRICRSDCHFFESSRGHEAKSCRGTGSVGIQFWIAGSTTAIASRLDGSRVGTRDVCDHGGTDPNPGGRWGSYIKGVFDEEWVDYLRQATAYQVGNPHFWAFAGTASKLYVLHPAKCVANQQGICELLLPLCHGRCPSAMW